MKKFTLFATAVLAMCATTAKAELMDKAFYRMPTFATIQDATVTASQEGTCPITVKSNKTNNTPRYLFTKWGEDAYKKCPATLPESGYTFSTDFTITVDEGVSNCMELVLASDTTAFKLSHMRLFNSNYYFFRMHQATNKSAEGKDSIYINGNIANDADWNFGEKEGTLALLTPGVKYEIRVNVNVEGTESKYTIRDVAADTLAAQGVKDITALNNKHIGMIWFNTSGASTYDFNNMTLSTLQNGPFATEPVANLFWVEGEERDYFAQFEEGHTLHWIQLGDAEDVISGETYEDGVEYTISYNDAMDTRDFEAGETAGRKIITCNKSGQLKIWTNRSDDETNVSDDVVIDVECVTLQLPAPTATITNVTEGYGKEYTLSVSNADVVLNPTITIHYELTQGGNKIEGDVLSGEKVTFTDKGTLTLYSVDKTHKVECYTKSETETIENNVEYVEAKFVDYQWNKEKCDGDVAGFTKLEIIDNANKSHWDRIYSDQKYGTKEDGTNEAFVDGTEYTYVKEGFGFYGGSAIGTDDAKWNAQVPTDLASAFLPLIPSEADYSIYQPNAWCIFPMEGIVYYDVNSTSAVKKDPNGNPGYLEMTIDPAYISDDEAKPNFFIINKRGGYDRPDKGNSNATEVVVAGVKFWLYRYDTAINSVRILTYKGFTPDASGIENIKAENVVRTAKMMVNGQLLIVKGSKTFNAAGMQVK